MIGEVRKRIEEEALSALYSMEPGTVHVISAWPGIGKSTSVARAVVRYVEGRNVIVYWLVNTKAEAEERYSLFKSLGEEPYLFKASDVAPCIYDGEGTYFRNRACRELEDRGVDPNKIRDVYPCYVKVRPSGAARTHDHYVTIDGSYVDCSDLTCPYMRQFCEIRNRRIVVMTYAAFFANMFRLPGAGEVVVVMDDPEPYFFGVIGTLRVSSRQFYSLIRRIIGRIVREEGRESQRALEMARFIAEKGLGTPLSKGDVEYILREAVRRGLSTYKISEGVEVGELYRMLRSPKDVAYSKITVVSERRTIRVRDRGEVDIYDVIFVGVRKTALPRDLKVLYVSSFRPPSLIRKILAGSGYGDVTASDFSHVRSPSRVVIAFGSPVRLTRSLIESNIRTVRNSLRTAFAIALSIKAAIESGSGVEVPLLVLPTTYDTFTREIRDVWRASEDVILRSIRENNVDLLHSAQYEIRVDLRSSRKVSRRVGRTYVSAKFKQGVNIAGDSMYSVVVIDKLPVWTEYIRFGDPREMANVISRLLDMDVTTGDLDEFSAYFTVWEVLQRVGRGTRREGATVFLCLGDVRILELFYRGTVDGKVSIPLKNVFGEVVPEDESKAPDGAATFGLFFSMTARDPPEDYVLADNPMLLAARDPPDVEFFKHAEKVMELSSIVDLTREVSQSTGAEPGELAIAADGGAIHVSEVRGEPTGPEPERNEEGRGHGTPGVSVSLDDFGPLVPERVGKTWRWEEAPGEIREELKMEVEGELRRIELVMSGSPTLLEEAEEDGEDGD